MILNYKEFLLVENADARIAAIKAIAVPKFNKIFHEKSKLTNANRPMDGYQPTYEDYTDMAEHAFKNCVKADPSDKKIYLQWIVNTASRGDLEHVVQTLFRMNEDHFQLANDLRLFDRVKAQMPIAQRDINHFKTINDLRIALAPFTDAKSNREVKKEEIAKLKTQITTLYSGPEGSIYIPKTYEASKYLGRGTKWCTAMEDTQQWFRDYSKDGPLYDLIFPNGKKWQFHIPSRQYMNELDHPLNLSEMVKEPLVKKWTEHIELYDNLEADDICRLVENFSWLAHNEKFYTAFYKNSYIAAHIFELFYQLTNKRAPKAYENGFFSHPYDYITALDYIKYFKITTNPPQYLDYIETSSRYAHNYIEIIYRLVKITHDRLPHTFEEILLDLISSLEQEVRHRRAYIEEYMKYVNITWKDWPETQKILKIE